MSLATLDTFEAIAQLVDDGAAENQHLEFKSNFVENGKDVLLTDGAKLSVAEEIVAFLNSSGGTIIIGISEDPDHRDCAGEIEKVANVDDKLRRISASIRALIQPYPAGVEFKSVKEHTEDVDGLIVIFVTSSSVKPHAVSRKGALRVLVRRGDGNVPLSIEELKNVVLNSYSSLENSIKTIKDAHTDFDTILRSTLQHTGSAVGFSLVLTPTSNLNLPPLWEKREFFSPAETYEWAFADGTLDYVHSILSARTSINSTILRGVSGGNLSENGAYKISVNRSGMIHCIFCQGGDRYFDTERKEGLIHIGWIMGELSAVHQITNSIEHNILPVSAEYLVSLKIDCKFNSGGYLGQMKIGIAEGSPGDVDFNIDVLETPTYRFSNQDEFLNVCGDVYHDIKTHGGQRMNYVAVEHVKPTKRR